MCVLEQFIKNVTKEQMAKIVNIQIVFLNIWAWLVLQLFILQCVA